MTKERIAQLQAIGEVRDFTDEEMREIHEGAELSAEIRDWCHDEAVRRGS
jgi:hypothetical protein